MTLAPLQALLTQAVDTAPAAEGLRGIDLLGFGLLLSFAFLGLLRGLWWQIFRLVALGAAVASARVAAPSLVEGSANLLPGMSRAVLTGVAWTLVFIIVLLVAAFVGRIGKKSLEAAQLSALDRTGGLVAGAVTGAALHFVLVVALDHLAPREFSRDLLAGTWSASLYTVFEAEHQPAYAADKSAEPAQAQGLASEPPGAPVDPRAGAEPGPQEPPAQPPTQPPKVR